MVQRGKPSDDHHPGPDQHEGPELQHLGQPGDAALPGLRRQAHQDGEPDRITQARDGRLEVHHPFEGIDSPAKQVHRADEREQQCEHDIIDRSGEKVPVNGTDGRLQQQARNKKTPSDEEAFLQVPGFLPH